MSDTNPAGRMHGCFFAMILLVGVPVVLAFDAMFVYGLFQQCRAWGFAEASGVVVSSKLEASRSRPGDTSYARHLAVTYRYTVDGREFTGDRYRYGGFSTADRSSSAEFGTGDQSWKRIADALPPGTAVAVYHDPANPAEATLTRGPQGFDLWLGNFLVPFNLIAVGLVVSRLGRQRPPGRPVEFTARWAWGAFAAIWGVVALVSAIALIYTTGFNPPLWAGAIPWVVGPGLGAAAVGAMAGVVKRAEKRRPLA